MATTGNGCDCLTCTERECTCPHAWVSVTLTFKPKSLAESLLPTAAGKWERLPDGRIRARYAPHELKLAVDVVKALLDGNGVAAHGLHKNGKGA